MTTTIGSVVMFRNNLTRTTLTDEEAARCVRPVSVKDYVQARIDGAIRFSHGGNEFRNRYTCTDGTERRQLEVSGTRVRCTLCPDARTWSLSIANLLEMKRHCGQLSDGHRRSARMHLGRLVSAAAAPGTPVSPPAASADAAGTVLGISLAQARALAEAASAGRLIPVHAESSATPDL